MSQERIFISEWSTNPIVLANCLFMQRYSSKFLLPDNAYACQVDMNVRNYSAIRYPCVKFF